MNLAHLTLAQALEALARGERVMADEMTSRWHWEVGAEIVKWNVSGEPVTLVPRHATWHFHIVPKPEPKSRIRELAEAFHHKNWCPVSTDEANEQFEQLAREVVEAVAKYMETAAIPDTLAHENAARIRREFLEPREVKRG